MSGDSDIETLASIERNLEHDDPVFVQAFRDLADVRLASTTRRALTAAVLIISVILCVATLFSGVPFLSILFALVAWRSARNLDHDRSPS